MKGAPKSYAKQLVLFVWVLVLIFYIYVSYDYLRVQRNDDKFSEALQHIVQVAGSEYRTNKEIRSLVLVRADEMDLPIKAEQIAIAGSGHTLNVSVGYDIPIDIPVFKRGFYTKHFNHNAMYRQSY